MTPMDRRPSLRSRAPRRTRPRLRRPGWRASADFPFNAFNARRRGGCFQSPTPSRAFPFERHSSAASTGNARRHLDRSIDRSASSFIIVALASTSTARNVTLRAHTVSICTNSTNHDHALHHAHPSVRPTDRPTPPGLNRIDESRPRQNHPRVVSRPVRLEESKSRHLLNPRRGRSSLLFKSYYHRLRTIRVRSNRPNLFELKIPCRNARALAVETVGARAGPIGRPRSRVRARRRSVVVGRGVVGRGIF